jgi:hypothetical protein
MSDSLSVDSPTTLDNTSLDHSTFLSVPAHSLSDFPLPSASHNPRGASSCLRFPQTVEATSRALFRCSKCHITFTRNSDLKRHQRSAFSGWSCHVRGCRKLGSGKLATMITWPCHLIDLKTQPHAHLCQHLPTFPLQPHCLFHDAFKPFTGPCRLCSSTSWKQLLAAVEHRRIAFVHVLRPRSNL